MKTLDRISILLVVVLTSVSFQSCDAFLTETPESTYTTETFYTSQSDFAYAIASVYAAQQDLYDGQYGLLRFSIGRSDDTNCYNTNTYMDGADAFTDNSSVKALEEAWTDLYVIITRANSILIRIDNVEFTDADLKRHIKGEAYALRGWAYHTLGVLFGGVPLIVDAEYSVEETKQIGRSTQTETFTQAESDYRKAIDLLPESWNSDGLGRITKYAAEASLGRLYMFMGDFSSALTALTDVINSGKYAMATNYVDCFSDDFDNTAERVWEVQYIGNLSGEGQTFSEISLPEYYTGSWAISGSSAAMQVSTNLLATYEAGDLRKQITVVDGITVQGALNEYTWFIKFNHASYVPQSGSDWDVNLPIIRYTDVLMMYAEAVNEISGPTSEAIDIVNKVRTRAGLAGLMTNKTSSRDNFREAIKQERRIEFAYEGLRWNDLVRWGDAMEVMNKFLQDQDEGNGIYQCDGTYRYIFAIPQEEITRYANSSKMWQNDGY